MANVSITTVQDLAGEEITNVYYMGGDVDIITHGQAIADAFRDAYINHLQFHMSVDWTLTRIDIRDLDVAGQPSIPFVPTGGTIAGTNLGNRLANQTALLISPRTNTPRPNRGRKYFSGLTEASFGNGVFDQAPVDAGVAFINELIGTLSAIGSDNALLLARVDPTTGLITAANVVSVVVGTTNPATRRSRRAG